MKLQDITKLPKKDYGTLKSGTYILKRKNGSKKIITINNCPSMTDQQFKKDCDVNYIVDKAMKTGQITHLAKGNGQYADVSQMPDLKDGLLQIKQAEEAFRKLPQKVRQVCRSPKELVQFLADPANDQKAIELGLKTKRQPSEKELAGKSASSKPEVKNDKINSGTTDKGSGSSTTKNSD